MRLARALIACLITISILLVTCPICNATTVSFNTDSVSEGHSFGHEDANCHGAEEADTKDAHGKKGHHVCALGCCWLYVTEKYAYKQKIIKSLEDVPFNLFCLQPSLLISSTIALGRLLKPDITDSYRARKSIFQITSGSPNAPPVEKACS